MIDIFALLQPHKKWCSPFEFGVKFDSKHRNGHTGKHRAEAQEKAAHKRRNRAERAMRRRNRR